MRFHAGIAEGGTCATATTGGDHDTSGACLSKSASDFGATRGQNNAYLSMQLALFRSQVWRAGEAALSRMNGRDRGP